MTMIDIKELEGHVLKSVTVRDNTDDDEIIFETKDGRRFKMYHDQDCCESVSIDQIDGDFSDLIGERIIEAYESSNQKDNDWGRERWTFYRISTFSGSVTIKWFGESNGYYSERVDFLEIT